MRYIIALIVFSSLAVHSYCQLLTDNTELKSLGQKQALVIANVNVVDVRNGTVARSVTVVIEGNRIKSIGKNTEGHSGKIIGGRNKYLIPGLWDMHTHNWNSHTFFPLLIANGVTGIRDMFGRMDSINKWRNEIDNGNLTGPVIYASGPIVDGPKPVWPGSVAVSTTSQVAGMVDSMKNQLKVDFLKVYSLIPRDVYFEIAKEAKKQGISFEGHLPNEIGVLEAAKAGQKTQEHLIGFLTEASDSADYLLKVAQRKIIDTTFKNPVVKMKLQVNTFNLQRVATIAKELAKYDTWICPTLTVARSIGLMSDTIFTNDERLHYMMPGMKNMWNPANDFRFKTLPPEYFELLRKSFALQLKVVKQLQDAGVKLLAGTDFPNPYSFPGFSLHDELQLMVKAGLTPLQALQTATINPALFFNITKDYGAVEQGKIANLVLLEKNPLDNIDNTRNIDAVILNGKLLDKQTLQAMLKKLWHE